jgi:hypothetical protein
VLLLFRREWKRHIRAKERGDALGSIGPRTNMKSERRNRIDEARPREAPRESDKGREEAGERHKCKEALQPWSSSAPRRCSRHSSPSSGTRPPRGGGSSGTQRFLLPDIQNDPEFSCNISDVYLLIPEARRNQEVPLAAGS